MKKIMNALTLSTTITALAATGYMLMKKRKKNMLDIIIEEIDSIK